KVIERVAEILPIDQVSIHEDMAGKSGPLWGPKQVNEFMKPYYKKIWKAAKEAGAKQFSQDSDGNINPIIQDIIDCGVTCIYPCEPAAGMDMIEIRKKYGKQLVLKGGIDKFALRADKDAIRKELEYKLASPLTKGGTIFGIDHQIPNGVTIENYRYYAKTMREILNLPPVTEKCWAPMAF
ncbi:MAG: uroporphyrinogen decarboxylase family protein, partial [Clostridia bacterium]